MSEVNYRRNGMKYSTTGKCWGMAPKAVRVRPAAEGPEAEVVARAACGEEGERKIVYDDV